MHFLTAVLVLSSMSLVQREARPVCNAANRGLFWPETANVSAKAARELFQNGELLMCMHAVWKYKWEHLSLNARSSARSKQTPSR
jgi:hypothetical protein